MRKIYFIAILCVFTPSAFGGQVMSDFCIVKNETCYWCSTYSGDQGGFCRPPYAGCSNKPAVNLSSGQSVTDVSGTTFVCGYSGFCYSSCSGEKWYNDGNGLEIKQIRSGCRCNEWTSTAETRCAAGYYKSSDSSNGCQKCPPYVTDLGGLMPVTSVAGFNLVIDDCYILPVKHVIDKSGEYDYVGNCYYGDNPTMGGGELPPPPPIITESL